MAFIDDIFNAHVKATERIFAEDRNKTVGASEIGQCARKTWWVKHGTAPDPDYFDTWGARMRGSVFEAAFWVPAFRRRFGKKLKFGGVQQMTFSDRYLSATPDGLIVDQPRDVLAPLIPDIGDGYCFLTECKTADPRTNLAKPKPEHEFQIQTQLGLVRLKTAYRPMFAVLSYADASFWHEVRVFAIKFDPATFESAQLRAIKIMTATSFDEMPPEGWIAGGAECEWCPFARRCGHERRMVPPNDTTETNTQLAAEIADLARAVKQQEADLEVATAHLRETQNIIKDRMRERGVRKIKSGDISVTWSAVKARQAWNNVAIREAATAAGIDVEQFSTVGDPTDRLLITVKQ